MPDYIIVLLTFAAVQVTPLGPASMILMANAGRFGGRAIMPFLAGIILGKELIIWPIGFGRM